jgi:hypothetical protein
MTTALLMTALLVAIIATAALLRAWLPGRLLTLAPNIALLVVALLVPISLILISISHVLIVFDITIRHEDTPRL